MSRTASKAMLFVILMVSASVTPMVGSASASDTILLSLDTPHIVMQGGDSTNATLTIENNGSSIENYNISLETDDLSDVWHINLVNNTTSSVIPTQSTSVDLVIVLDIGALPSDSGSFVVNVSEQDGDLYSTMTAYVTVEPSYASSLAFNSMNGPLQQMYAGTSANYTIDVNNDGNAPDTILLDVDAEPDLASFWANHTNNTNNQNNNSIVDVPENILMYGNTLISNNNVNVMLADIFDSVGEHNSTIANTGISGYDLPMHLNDINTSGNVWNTSLRDSGHTWDLVVFHDQSQTPGYPRSNSEWIESKDAGIELANIIESEGSEVMLMMTWGFRNGDSLNPMLYSNFTNMQERLEDGYTDYHDNMTTPTRDVWIAPVGLAYENVYYRVMDDGGTPSLPGNTFYELYDSNGREPSLTGSYLAACVLYASMTGNASVETNDTIALSAALKLELQQAADDTVFNQTSDIEYPWQQSSSPSIMSQSRTIPPGWNLVFADQELSNMPAGSTSQTTIQVSIPSDAAPGFYGFNLFSASTNGNTSNSYTFVVEVLAENNLSFSFLDQDSDFIPGQISTTSIQVTNTGNSELDLNWQLEVTSGPCVVQLIDAMTNDLSPGASENIGFTLDVDSTATKSDECVLSLDGEGMYGDYSYDAEAYEFNIGIDELIVFELYSPTAGVIELTPQNPEQYEIRVYNNGSELVEFFLDIDDDSPLSTSLISSSSVNVSAGGIGVWTLVTDIANGFVGAYSQGFTSTYSDSSSTSTVDFDIQPVANFSMSGPLDGRISTKPGESVDVQLSIINTGTMDLDLTASVAGLPTGADATFSSTEVDLDTGITSTVTMSVSMISTAQSGSYPLNITYSSVEFSQSLSLELQVADSVGLTVNSINNNIAAGPISEVIYTFEVTNLGSASDTFFVALDFDENNNASSWFDTTLSTSSINLDPSSTQAVTISIRERVAGAPTSGCDVGIIVTSSNDDTVSSAIGFKIIPIQASAQITVLSGDDSAKPGEAISGDVVVTNTGTGEDQFLLTTIGEDCGLSEIFTLSAGASSQVFSWSCTIDSGASAGSSSLTFRVTSNARSNYVVEEVESFTVEENWDNDDILEISFKDESLSMASSGGSSTTITVKNKANAPVNGNLFIIGNDTSLFDIILTPVNSETPSDEFTLANGQSAEFEILINSRVSESESALLSISATVVIGGVGYPAESNNELVIMIDGPELPPNGVELPFGVVLDEQQSISAMVGGWVFAILLLVLMNFLRKRRKIASVKATIEEAGEQEESKPDKKPKKKEEKTIKAHKLQSNECRMTPDNKVICPFCEAKLGVPRGSIPPFKFSCPQCDKKIRVVENQKF
ncbi:MAG TPA: hypothetical protein HA359_02470 [Candidatus Poseidoniaceae archaeon]|nr:hypothetical protein [Candidatus Poseidoniaceae archaeon]